MAWKYLDSELTASDFDTFEKLLENDPVARRQYQTFAGIQQALEEYSVVDSPAEPISFAGDREKRIIRFPWGAGFGAAAVLALLLVLHLGGEKPLNVHYVSLRDVDFRGETVKKGQRADTTMMHLMRGAVAIRFPGDTRAVIEGPAWYQIQDDNTLKISAGTITVDHRGKPGSFKVLTPVGRLTEMGTKFGVSVGNGVNDSIVMTEVYEGKVIFDGGEKSPFTISEGGAFAIIGNSSHQVIEDFLGSGPVKIEPTFELSESTENIRTTKNLAGGKPVTSPAFYNRPVNGEIFGPAALTDNRDNDSGSPWDWSFWLGANDTDGSFTVDLLEPSDISRIELQNTRNRSHLDRETRRFRLETSLDGETFTPLLEDTLASVRDQKTPEFSFQSFGFPSVKARYVRFTGFVEKTPGEADRFNGVGLNEIRIFE